MTRPYHEQLAGARKAIAAMHGILADRDLPTDLRDQIHAATSEAKGRFDTFAAVLPLIEGGRDWKQRVEDKMGPAVDEVAARTMAAIAYFQVCSHLRRTPQPVWARMPLRRLDCQRCVLIQVRPPSDEDDRCDWCGLGGVSTFWPLVYTMGPMLVAGDACKECADALRIGRPQPPEAPP